MLTQGFYSIVLIVGPLLLLGVIVFVWARNRSAGRANVERAERGAAELRSEIERGDPPPQS